MITIITTCKGRSDHLRQSLPLMQATGWDVIVVGDRDSSWSGRQVAAWISGGPWNKARWLNVGLAYVDTPYVMFVDADVLLDPEAVRSALDDWLSGIHFLCVGYDQRGVNVGLTGWLVAPTDSMHARGGYDERMVGWGAEDLDMRLRLAARTTQHKPLDPCFLFAAEVGAPIRHGDDLRVQNQDCKQKEKSLASNMVYLRENYERLTGRTFEEGMRLDPLVRALCTVKFDDDRP